MSFDLYLYKRTENPLTEEAVADYLNQNLTFNNSQSTRQWVYENPDTGVYFIINWNDKTTPEYLELDLEEDDEFEGYTNLNFDISINFIRPHYFAYEIFPVIEKIATDLDLFIFDPQDRRDLDIPLVFDREYLQNEWITQNEQFCISMFEEHNFLYMPSEKADYIWNFQFARKSIEESLIDEDIYIANPMVLTGNDNHLYTIATWPEHIPIVLPKVDFVFIKKKYKRFFRWVEESGAVSYGQIMSKLGHAFESLEHDVPELKILRQAEADKIYKEFNELKIEHSVAELGKKIGLDNFVTARP